MDIAALSMAFSQSKVQQQASVSIMRKVMDQATENGAFVQEMLSSSGTEASVKALQHAAQPHLGTHIDMKG
ncbi:YjfB family protein [Virgibacillus soli]|uniref:YjfB family protein n=1 Tax=Paracerasibacillus soli TaxID=480284 RepID=A0ABU5CRW7_9BACI|nr:YjfB family protein [Virgibacillus soli]MDY0408980.1 YjfB family protein [Virgibacillus soli]